MLETESGAGPLSSELKITESEDDSMGKSAMVDDVQGRCTLGWLVGVVPGFPGHMAKQHKRERAGNCLIASCENMYGPEFVEDGKLDVSICN